MGAEDPQSRPILTLNVFALLPHEFFRAGYAYFRIEAQAGEMG